MKKFGLPAFVLLQCTLSYLYAAPTQTRYAGQLKALDPNSGPYLLPLKETRIDLDITANIVHASVSQVFYNDSDMNLEAVYTFPLPAGATVTDMELVYSDRRIRSVVQEKVQARRIYENARDQGQRTALIEEDLSHIFKTSVANFAPGEEVTVIFSYVEQLPFTGRVYEVNFPTTFGPKFMPEMVELPDIQLTALAFTPNMTFLDPPRSESPGHTVQLTARISGLPIRNIYSNTHHLIVEETHFEQFTVELAEVETLPDRDLTLKLELMEEEQPQLSFLQSENGEYVHGMATLFPPLAETTDIEAMPKEVVFLIDTSGSMNGEPMEQAKEGLRECLLMLNPNDRFNIVRFSNDYSSMNDSFLGFSHQTENRALNYIDGLHASGGTEMQKAMSFVLDLPKSEGYMRMVVFLTDGDVGNESSLLRLVDHRLGDARIYSFGVGSAPNEFLLRKLSETGYGVANFLKNDEDIGEAMSNFFETVNSPVLTDVSLTWRNKDGSMFENLTQFPEVIPDVFLNRPVQLCYRYSDYFNGYLEVNGKVNNNSVSYAFEVTDAETLRHKGVEQLFGQALVNRGMMDWTGARDEEEKQIARQDVIDTAIAYGLVTPFTSRVAVEEKIRNLEPVQAAVVPLMKKYGTAASASHFAPTATNGPLLIFLGGLAMMLGLGAHFTQRLHS